MLETGAPSFVELKPLVPAQYKLRARRLRHMRRSSQLAVDDYRTDPDMTDHGIPPFLQNAYLTGAPMPSITSLRDWQRELFEKEEWKRGDNAIVLVPTSGGKTLAADVAIARELAKDPEAKAIYALPFVSLASEKTNEYRQRFNEYHVRPFYQNIGGPDFRRGSIAICTYEKVHSLINCAIKDDYIDKLKVVVIDEVHMIGEEQRGAVIEAIIVKLLLLRPLLEIRIIGLTATLNQEDANRLASWIKGFTYFCSSRPSRIKHFFKNAAGMLFRIDNNGKQQIMQFKSIPEDTRHILIPIRQKLANQPSSMIIVFVNRRKDAVEVATFIAKYLYFESDLLPKMHPVGPRLQAAKDLLIQRLAKTETGLDKTLEYCVKNGVAFHHAGMLLEERKLIEDAARDSTISVVVATTTLSAGINIRSVSRVIIHDIYRNTKTLIPTSVYTQMAGRAGRDERAGGDVFILARTNDEKEMNDALKLAKQQLEDIKPQLLEENVADRYFLQCLVSGLCSPEEGLSNFVHTTLGAFLSNNNEQLIGKHIDGIAERLRAERLIEQQNVAATPLGKAIAGSSLSIEEGLELKEAIDNLQTNLCLRDEVHLLYLCVPPGAVTSTSTPPYDAKVWQVLADEHQEVIKLITSLDSRMFERHLIITMRNGGKRLNSDEMAKHDRELDRFFFACLLQRLITEQSINDIVNLFAVTRGSVQTLQMQAATFVGQSVRFCETTGSRTLGKALNTFRERLNFGVKNELLPLMKLPSCNRQTARLLISNRISGPLELAELPDEAIAQILAQRRGDDRPFEKERELAAQLKDEARMVSRSLNIIEELENSAVAGTVSDAFSTRPG